MYFTPTKRMLYRSSLFILTSVLFFSCQKEFSIGDGNSNQLPDLTTKINSSVSGFVTDENNAAVMGASVQFGSSTITTDKYGHFELKNVQVVKETAVVTVTKPGYFKGIKTYIAKEGKAAFFRIKLIPKTIVGNINGTSGGSVTLTNGLSISLPAGAVVNAATNTAYTGTVNVAEYWLNPTAADLNQIMPGDLRGIDQDGSMKLLQTFGMAAVELTGSSGELLQIATGKKATLTLPIPSSLSATVPASIPLWYFDETNGLWKEQGSAVKTGNTYVGDVSHFSFWNYSLPGPYIQFDATVVDANGNPLQFAFVRISLVNSPNQMGTGFTDLNGYINGVISANSQLTLEILADISCGTSPAAYSQIFSTANTNISLGNISIPLSSVALVTGTVQDCNNIPVSNGYVFIYTGRIYRLPLSNSGSFGFRTVACNPLPIWLIAYDLTNMQNSNIINSNLAPGNNNVGNITACNNIQIFLNTTLDGINHNFLSPPDWIIEYWHSSLPSTTDIKLFANTSSLPWGSAEVHFKQQNIAVNSNQDLISFKHSSVPDSLIPTSTILVHITEYGNIGQYISGNFSGVLKGHMNPAITYNVSCNFRVKREY